MIYYENKLILFDSHSRILGQYSMSSVMTQEYLYYKKCLYIFFKLWDEWYTIDYENNSKRDVNF